MTGEVNTLAGYLGDEVAGEVVACGRERGWTARVPARPWRSHGYTGAVVALLNVTGPAGVQKMILKVVPPVAVVPAPERAGDPYDTAARDCPAVFRAHLVMKAQPPWPTTRGGLLVFQKLAGDDVLACRSLDQLPYRQLVDVSRLIGRALLLDWNVDGLNHNTGAYAGSPPTYAEFLRQALSDPLSRRKSMHRYAEDHALAPDRVRAIRFPDGTICPNPLYLVFHQSPLDRLRLDVLTGHSHGDLHLRNVVVPDLGGGRPALDQFQLVDLDTYRRHRSLAADPVFLLLSAMAEWLPNVPGRRWDAVRNAILHPARTDAVDPPVDIARAVYGATVRAIRGLDSGLTGDWPAQFLLTTLATALSFTTFAGLGPTLRAWFFRLAAECGRSVISALNEPIPEDAISMGEMFR